MAVLVQHSSYSADPRERMTWEQEVEIVRGLRLLVEHLQEMRSSGEHPFPPRTTYFNHRPSPTGRSLTLSNYCILFSQYAPRLEDLHTCISILTNLKKNLMKPSQANKVLCIQVDVFN